VVLLILTLSLSTFTATLAGTLDQHLHDQLYYQVGADASFLDLGEGPDPDSSDTLLPNRHFLPVTDYRILPNVVDATRVGHFSATALLSGRYEAGTVLGIDRYNFPSIAFWRQDFASVSLGELMNRLGANPDGLLVPEDFWARYALNRDALITLQLSNDEISTPVRFRVVGTFALFPTYYPDNGSFFVANLDYLFQELGGEYPYQVWLTTRGPVPLADGSPLAMTTVGALTPTVSEPLGLIQAEQARPERQGLYGVLSIGFGAAALLTVLGFVMYALLSYQRRFVELGVLRAIGLSSGQMIAFLAAELALLIVTGGAIGTGLGVWISDLFIPYLQIGGPDASALIPPYLVTMAWPTIFRVYVLFGLLFVGALAGLVLLLRRLRIFQAIKMGESL
jgi:putative ABC transport system permease protein